MKEGKTEKGRFGTLVLGVSIMAILYGWFVYAGEIETDAANIAQTISSNTNGSITINPASTALVDQVANAVEAQQNSSISADLYTTGQTMAPGDAMITKHFNTYCASGPESGNCQQDPLLQFGDIKISSIISGTAYDAPRAQAAQDFLINLMDPPPGPSVTTFQTPMNASTVTADPTMKANFIQALSDEAVLSVVREPFAEMIAKRTVPSSSSGSGGAAPVNSMMQMMEMQADQRLMSTSWATALKAMPALQVQQDQALMQAYQVWLEYQRYRQMERVEALLATLVLQNWRSAKALSQQLANQPTAQTAATATQQAGGTSTSPPPQ